MPVLGLVATLEDGSKAGRSLVLERLLRERDITVGDLEGGKLPVVLEADGRDDAEARVRALSEIDGVAHVDVVFAHFEDLLPRPGEPIRSRTGESKWS